MDKRADEAELHRQLALLAEKFLRRTHRETEILQTLIDRLDNSASPLLAEVDHLSHKIHGSAATFGFGVLSAHAGDIERLIGLIKTGAAVSVPLAALDLQRLSLCRQLLAEEIDAQLGNSKAAAP